MIVSVLQMVLLEAEQEIHYIKERGMIPTKLLITQPMVN